MVSTITGEAALLSGTSRKERAADATRGLLYKIKNSECALLVIKDVTSILSMNRDTRALILAALREIHDGRWSRDIGGEGGRRLDWEGRIVVIGAVTTAWDAAHQVISTMGDRFVLVRLAAGSAGRKAAGMQAMRNVKHETEMRADLSDEVGKLLQAIEVGAGQNELNEAEIEDMFDLADLVTRTRTAVERDFQGDPAFAHALEMPTRFAKQLVQLARGGLALGMTRTEAIAVVERAAADSVPPLRLAVLTDVAAHADTATAEVVKRLQLPWKTVDRALQELQLLGVLVVYSVAYGMRTRWIYQLAGDLSETALKRLARNVSGRAEGR